MISFNTYSQPKQTRMSLLATLPAPKQQHGSMPPPSAAVPAQQTSTALTTTGREAPPYLRRKGFVPRRQEDFKDGEHILDNSSSAQQSTAALHTPCCMQVCHRASAHAATIMKVSQCCFVHDADQACHI